MLKNTERPISQCNPTWVCMYVCVYILLFLTSSRATCPPPNPLEISSLALSSGYTRQQQCLPLGTYLPRQRIHPLILHRVHCLFTYLHAYLPSSYSFSMLANATQMCHLSILLSIPPNHLNLVIHNHVILVSQQVYMTTRNMPTYLFKRVKLPGSNPLDLPN